MKVSELSQRSGVPIPSIKYYLREGLLPSGRVQGNQATYDEEHLRRLELIRALREVGQLSIGAIRRITESLDRPAPDTLAVLGQAVDALSDRADQQSEPPEPERAKAEADVDRFLAARGWAVRPDAAARRDLVAALVTLRQLHDLATPVEAFDLYAQKARDIAAQEIAWTEPSLRATPSEALEAVVLGTVLWEPVFLSLRRLAHEDLTSRLLGVPPHAPEGAVD